MSYAHQPALEGASETSATLGSTSNRRSVLAYLLEALHESRRLQAARTIHRYRHLLSKNGADTTSG